MSLPRRASAWAALALLATAPALADPANLADMVDDLQRIQFQIAQGDKAAYPRLRIVSVDAPTEDDATFVAILGLTRERARRQNLTIELECLPDIGCIA